MRAAVGIAALLCLVATAGATQSDRLREKSISLLPDNALTDEDYTPRHLAGYFKAWLPPKLNAEQNWCCNFAAFGCADCMLDCLQLNRTYAGEMFYLFFEHRTSDDAPLVLWMTGEPLSLAYTASASMVLHIPIMTVHGGMQAALAAPRSWLCSMKTGRSP